MSKDQFYYMQIYLGSTKWNLRNVVIETSAKSDDLTITPYARQNKLKHLSESRASSTSWLHLMHYKVLLETTFAPHDTRMAKYLYTQ